jgi:hypothetical protein
LVGVGYPLPVAVVFVCEDRFGFVLFVLSYLYPIFVLLVFGRWLFVVIELAWSLVSGCSMSSW